MATNNKQQKQQKEQKQVVKREKLTLDVVKAMLNLSAEEMEHAKNLLSVGFTPAKIRDNFLKKRKEEEKAKEKAKKEKAEKEEIAKKAVEKAENAKALYNELKNLPPFKNFEKELFTIKNVSNYQNFKGKTWKVYGVDVEQEISYIITKEYNRKGEFDLICAIPVDDVILDYNRVMINDYEKDCCLPMEYVKI